MTNKEIRTYDDMVEEILYLRRTLRSTATFLEQLAEHLELSGMPGQAGNCMLRAHALRAEERTHAM